MVSELSAVLKRRRVFALGLVPLSGCSSMLSIDKSFEAVSQDSRVRFLILHYTYGDFEESLKTLTQGQVSSHYLISREPPKIFQLVDENRRAYHAGESYWKGATALNASSIGIEVVNRGGRFGPDGHLHWQDYPKEQIDLLISLCKEIVKRHGITPDRVLGHSDIAPGRKVDPGPKFPWERFAKEGLVIWPEADRVKRLMAELEPQVQNMGWWQTQLRQLGFNPPSTAQLDPPTRDIIVAFQMKFRQSRYDGTPDLETAAILAALNEQSTRAL